MHDTILKSGSKYLPISRTPDDKADGLAGAVGTGIYTVAQLYQPAFVVELVHDGACCPALSLPAVKIGVHHSYRRYHISISILAFLYICKGAETGLTLFWLVALVLLFMLPLLRFRFQAFVALYSQLRAVFAPCGS